MAVVVGTAALVVGTGASPVGAAPTEDGPTAARYGAAWLATQLDAGIPMQNFGSADWGVTLDGALGLVASGTGGDQVEDVWDALVTDRESAVTVGGADAPGRIARAIMLAIVTGHDPRSVGTGVGGDLIARLESTMRVDGADAGLYGSSSPTYDGAFRQGYSIAALIAAGETPDQLAVDWLASQQCDSGDDSGSWMPYRSDLAVPCAADPAAFVGPDTNATAAGITALAALGEQDGDATDAALSWLDRVQEADGGWGQMAGYGTDPNSTALVLSSLIAVDQADSSRFADKSRTPLAALLSFQLGCEAPEADRGAFTFPGSNNAPNGFATAQALGVAAGEPFVFEPGDVTSGVTTLDCTPATTTTTTSTLTTSTTSTTVASSTTVAPSTTLPATTVGAQVQGLSQSSDTVDADSASTASAPSTLPTTGTDSPLLLVPGAAALLGGAALVLVGRRREA